MLPDLRRLGSSRDATLRIFIIARFLIVMIFLIFFGVFFFSFIITIISIVINTIVIIIINYSDEITHTHIC